MTQFKDFPNGLQSADDYLSSVNSFNAELNGSVLDIGRLVVSGEMDFNLKEIICSLLAGRGLKLPNLQICISLNLKGLLGDFIGQIQDVLYAALAALDAAFDKFLDHLGLDAVLGRINGLLGDITSLANMINFCSAPIDPIQIPNVLENAMDSFLGGGMAIIDSIGTMLPDSIGGCLVLGLGSGTGGGFNGGILGDLNNVYDDLITGNLSDDVISSIVADIDSVTNAIDALIDSETNVATNYDQGGSDPSALDGQTGTTDTNTGIGVLYNSGEQGLSGATSNGAALWSAYQNLGSYQVQDSDGTTYNNIFETFCDPALISILRRTPDPTPEIAAQIPVYSYCGDVIGFTKDVTQQSAQITSAGAVPDPIDQPGFNAGGISTDPANVTTTTDTTTDTAPTTTNLTGLSLGDGMDVFKQRVADQFQFRSITAGDNISIVQSPTEIAISAAVNQLAGTNTTTSATSVEVLFNDDRLTPANDKTWFVTVIAVGRRTDDTDVTAIKVEALVDNNLGTVSIPGSGGNVTRFNGTAGTDNYDVLLDVRSDQLRVRVKGDIGHTVAWKVKFDFVESP